MQHPTQRMVWVGQEDGGQKQGSGTSLMALSILKQLFSLQRAFNVSQTSLTTS